MRAANRNVLEAVAETLAREEVTTLAAAVLCQVDREGTVTIDRLARAYGVTNGVIAGVIQGLEARGMIACTKAEPTGKRNAAKAAGERIAQTTHAGRQWLDDASTAAVKIAMALNGARKEAA